MPTSTNYEILLTIRDISLGGMTTERLAMRRAVGQRTIKNYIAEARNMGADIDSFRVGNKYEWRITNWHDIRDRLNEWIDIEETRCLIRPKYGYASGV